MALAELLVKLGVRGDKEVSDALDKTKSKIKDTGEEAGRGTSRLRSFGDGLLNISKTALSLASGLGAAAAGLGAVKVASSGFDTYVKYDDMTRGLASVSVNAEDLTGKIARLKEIAKLPGLGFEEAEAGVLRLQSAQLSANLAERSLMAFGNALASVGKGKDDLDGVTLALQQMAAKGQVFAEEINQVNERVPQIRAIMQRAFGTADSEELQKRGIGATQFIEGVVTELEKLPRITGGIGNALENLGDLAKNSLKPIGQGLADMLLGANDGIEEFFKTVEMRANQIGEVLSAMGRSGVVADILKNWNQAFSGMFGADFQQGVVRVAAGIGAALANLPKIFQQTGAYLVSLFDVIRNNIGETFRYVGELGKSAIAKITAVIGTLAVAGEHFSNFDFKSAREVVKGLPFSLNAIDTFAPVKAPDYKALPRMPFADLMAGFNADRDRYQQMISGSLKPLSPLPDGLVFGGVQSPMPQKQEATLLERIERNTSKSANALDALNLRRQVYGGGDVARVGVTAAEMSGGAIPAGAYGGGGYGYIDGSGRSVTSDLEQSLRRLVNSQMSARGVGGFRPGRG